MQIHTAKPLPFNNYSFEQFLFPLGWARRKLVDFLSDTQAEMEPLPPLWNPNIYYTVKRASAHHYGASYKRLHFLSKLFQNKSENDMRAPNLRSCCDVNYIESFRSGCHLVNCTQTEGAWVARCPDLKCHSVMLPYRTHR